MNDQSESYWGIASCSKCLNIFTLGNTVEHLGARFCHSCWAPFVLRNLNGYTWNSSTLIFEPPGFAVFADYVSSRIA